MQGEPVTLSNIQQSVKKSLTNEKGEESPVAKILLFPFRMLAVVFEAIGKLIGPFSKVLVEVLRVFAGAIIMLVGLSTMTGLLIALLILFGFSSSIFGISSLGLFPLEVLPSTFSSWSYLSLFISLIVPFLFVALLGISILAKRLVINATLGWTLFGLWVLSALSLGLTIPGAIAAFSNESDYSETKRFEISADPVTMRVNYVDGVSYDDDMVRLRGHQDSTFKLVTNYTARGKSRSIAQENAQMISYNVESKDDEILFDSDFVFRENAKFRAQNVEATLYIPYGRTFKVEREMEDLLGDSFSRAGYWKWQIKEENLWVFTQEGLTCLTCEKKETARDNDTSELEYMEDEPSGINNGVLNLDLDDFDEIEINGFYKVLVEQDKEFGVRVVGPEKILDQMMVKKFGDVLEIRASKKPFKWLEDWPDDQKPKVYISMPDLKKIKTSGFCHIVIDEMETNELRAELSGASTASLDVEVEDLYLKLNGGTWIELEGRANYAKADISGASSLKALNMKTKTFDIKASGVSKAKIRVKDKLLASVSGISQISYEGDPETEIKNEGGLSSVEQL